MKISHRLCGLPQAVGAVFQFGFIPYRRRMRSRFRFLVAADVDVLEQRTLLAGAAPTLNPIADLQLAEDSGENIVSLAGISAGGSESQPLKLRATSSTALIQIVNLAYTSPLSTAVLKLMPAANRGGSTVVTITVEDGGPDRNLSSTTDNAIFSRSFTVNVGAVADLRHVSFAVDSRSDVTHAGRSSTPAPNWLLPMEVPLPLGQDRWIEFSNVAGVAVAGPGWPTVGPDGGTIGPGPTYGTNIFSARGISGIVAGRFQFLSGVFLTDAIPDADPPRLDFLSLGTDFRDLVPLMHQTFFIGNGSTSSGSVQRFHVPDDATRVFLGIIDSATFGWPQGGDVPYAYQDNTGHFYGDLHVRTAGENDLPAMDAISPVSVNENSAEYSINLSKISPGTGESQPVRISVENNNPSVITSPVVDYVNPSTTGSVRFSPVPEKIGNSTLTITVEDGGLDHDLNTPADNLSIIRTVEISVIPLRTTVTSPNGTTSLSRPEFQWLSLPDAVSYDIWINNESTRQRPYVNTNVTSTSFQPDVDLGIGSYDIWVRGVSESGARFSWSIRKRFIVSIPVTLEPVAPLQKQSRPTLSWQQLEGAARYDLWLNNVSAGLRQVVRVQDLEQPQWTPESDLPMGIYDVWVRGLDASGGGAAWSRLSRFQVAPQSILLSPLSGTFDRSPTLKWQGVSGAAKYDVFLRNSRTNQIVADIRGFDGVQMKVAASLPVDTYRWWVLPISSAGVRGTWSQPGDFHVGGKAEVTAPAGNANLLRPIFTWKPVELAATYQLWLNRIDVPQNQIILQTDLAGTSFSTTADLVSGARYRVWVRAVSTTGELGLWSVARDFQVA